MSACSLVPLRGDPVPGNAVLIPDVPLYRQDLRQCGPVAVATVLDYWHNRGRYPQQADLDAIRQEIFSENAAGTLPLDIELYAQRHGLSGEAMQATFDDLRGFVDEHVPVIVFVDYGAVGVSRDHFMVVTGYGADGGVVAHTGREVAYFSRKYFMRIWEKNGRWVFVFKPQ